MSKPLPPLRALQAFEAAARHGSFARAAAELGVTPAAISQQIKLLEDVVETRLFDRGPPLALDPHAAEAADALTDAFERLARAAARLEPATAARPLVVSMPPAFASRWLVPRLERFHARHPEVELHLSATLRLVDLEREGVDLAIRYGSGNYAGLKAERLWLEEVVAVAAPRLAASITRPADLLGCSLLVNQSMGWDRGFPDWPAWLAEMGVEMPPARLRPFGDAALVIEAALAGLGVALVWRTLVGDELMAGRLVALFPGRPLSSAYHLVHGRGGLDRPGARAFRAWIMEEAEDSSLPTHKA